MAMETVEEIGYRCGRCNVSLMAGTTMCPVCGAALARPGETTRGAPIGRRLLSWFVDSLIVGVLLVLVFSILAAMFPEEASEGSDGGIVGAIGSLATLLLPAYYAVPFDARSGQTPGRRVAGIRVAALDGRDRLGVRSALVRATCRLLSLVSLGVGFLWAIAGQRRTWHDILSQSVVIDVDAAVVVVEERPRPTSLTQHQVVGAPGAPVAASVAPGSHADPAPAPVPAQPGDPVGDQDRSPALVLDPHTGRSLAEALADRAHFEESARLLAQTLRAGERAGEPAVAEDWCRVALLLVDGGLPTEALAITNELLLSEPTMALALAVKAHALLSLGAGTAAEALEVARRAVNYGGTEPLAVSALASALVANGQLDECEAVLGDGLDLGTHARRRAWAHHSLADLRGDYSGALRWAVVAVDAEPFDARAHVRAATTGLVGPRDMSAPVADRAGGEVRRMRQAVVPTVSAMDVRCGMLERALELEPQCDVALKAVIGFRPAARRRVALNVLWSACVGLLVAGSILRLLPLAPGLAVAGIVVGALGWRLIVVVGVRRAVTPRIVEWRRYADGFDPIRFAWKGHRDNGPTRPPTPPPNTVLESAARCNCDSLNFLFGELAVVYARQHLVTRGSYSAGLTELVCPSTLARWLAVQLRDVQTNEAAPLRLCRVGDVWPAEGGTGVSSG